MTANDETRRWIALTARGVRNMEEEMMEKVLVVAVWTGGRR